MSDTNGVGMRGEDDGDRAGHPSGRRGLGRGCREDDIDFHAGQVDGRFVHLLNGARPSEFDDKVLAFDLAEIPQARPKRLDSGRRGRGGTETQVSEARNFGLLLCACSQRPHEERPSENRLHPRLDVAYRTIDSPVGALLLAATAKGLVRVAYGCEDHEKVLERLARDLSPRILHAPARLDAAAKEIDEYFAGLRQRFDLPVGCLARGFRRLVLTRLRAISYGQTASYAAIAVAAGNPKAVRAVGTA